MWKTVLYAHDTWFKRVHRRAYEEKYKRRPPYKFSLKIDKLFAKFHKNLHSHENKNSIKIARKLFTVNLPEGTVNLILARRADLLRFWILRFIFATSKIKIPYIL